MKGCRLRRTRTGRDDDELVTKGGKPWKKETEKKLRTSVVVSSVLFQRICGQQQEEGKKVGTRVILVVKPISVYFFSLF